MAIIDHTSIRPRPITPKKYFIYALIDPRDETLFYVGITKDIAKRLGLHMSNRNPREARAKRDYIDSLKADGLKPDVKVLDEFFAMTSSFAYHIESAWIRLMQIRLGTLVNISLGAGIETEAEALHLIAHYKELDSRVFANIDSKIRLSY